MNVGIVVHGPEIIDSGFAERIFEILRQNTNINLQIKLGGTIGRVAVIDKNLENTIDISEKLFPSDSLKKLENNDVLIILNYGKSKITGHTFGKIVIERSAVKKPIIQVERPGEEDGTILIWNSEYLEKSKDFNEISEVILILKESLKLNVENCISEGISFFTDGNMSFRRIHGVDANESIMLNGIIIGKALNNELVIVSKNGKIVDIIGGIIKVHGIEKLGHIDLKKAVIKTGILRKNPSKNFESPKYDLNSNVGELIFINHAGEDTLDRIKDKKICAVITVGDDTTTICGDILARFGVKIIGITNGDKDDILKNPAITKGSAIFLIKNHKDDDVGKLIHLTLKDKNFESFDYYIENIKDTMVKNNIEFEEITY
ncbi:conserved hypothetical protein [Methanococcus vannielii SB]|uniref:DUF2117 domain-containing protein n=1 Tax=Methanococcus vannielii (strain ATCC 35089 / DSM 1224 / JCM 13029 / OCM 148 / SB) TaxID=406327 RepID=A6URC5_METVS|nr:DUF2117 domain-containing protein [Methanococcus vannielii]ABR55047.1 conserved hypothetical protein [Methanococcus vannielii SB]